MEDKDTEKLDDTKQANESDAVLTSFPVQFERAARIERRQGGRRRDDKVEEAVPAWIYGRTFSFGEPGPAVVAPPGQAATQSRERRRKPLVERQNVRWSGAKGVSEGALPVEPLPFLPAAQPPIMTVLSMAGGVGKTSLVATLGRALSATGERVLLADTSTLGPLPFYFGAKNLRPETLRVFSPPLDSADSAISLVSYDVLQRTAAEPDADASDYDWLTNNLSTHGRGMQRILVDMVSGTGWLGRKLAAISSMLLVPLAADMNSVILMQNAEKFLCRMAGPDGLPAQPFYLLNQFDASLPLHMDVRETMRRQLGDRLLPFTIRRDAAVPEALAEGMTVIDYAPESAVASDYKQVMGWLRADVAPATATGSRNIRWSERSREQP